MTYSSSAVQVATASLLASTIALLNEKGLITTADAVVLVQQAYDKAKKGSPEIASEMRKVYNDMFPNVSLTH